MTGHLRRYLRRYLRALTGADLLAPLLVVIAMSPAPPVPDFRPVPIIPTTAAPAAPPARPVPPRRAARRRTALPHRWQLVDATAYCATGHRMANGRWPHPGAVAANRWPLGTRLWIRELEQAVTVEDRIGHGSQLDRYLPGPGCQARALRFGRQPLHVQPLAGR